jgi:CRISPR-associated protein Cas1
MSRLERHLPLDVVRGIAGEAANLYFGVFDSLISNPDPAFTFNGRNRRPPLDAVNCLLSFLYTVLAHDVRSALESVGLDPAVGFLHRDRPGRPSLALDLMEEFRPYLADRLACTLINRGQVKSKGFRKLESGAVLMDDATRKEVIVAWQERKREEIDHPFLQEKMPAGLLWHAQARLLARCIRGDMDAYPPFVIR